MSRIRLGFIGVGGYGRAQIDGFLALQSQGLVQITALADSSAAVLKGLDELTELRSAERFADYRDLLASEQLDAVVITVPIPLHEEVTLAALERDLVILLEKPPVPLLSQLERLIDADIHGRVMVGFQHIYSNIIRELKRELVSGRIGEIQSISAHGVWPRHTLYYDRSAWAGQLVFKGYPVLDGPCTNGFSHFINTAQYLAGTRAETFALPLQVSGEVYRARPGLATYDTGCLSGILENDVHFFFGFSHNGEKISRVEIQIEGTEGKLRLFHDCEILQFDNEECVRGDDGRHDLRRAFVAFAAGDSSQNLTPLHVMKAYLLATNLMLSSSGGIHNIGSLYVRCVDAGTENAVFAVDGIATYLSQAARQIVPLCATAAPWAQKTTAVSASTFSELDLIKAFDLPIASTAQVDV